MKRGDLLHGEHARDACARVGHDAIPRTIDVEDAPSVERALEGVSTVVCCVTQRARTLLHACVRRGIAYTDTAPDLTRWQGAPSLEPEARASGACIVLGTGIAPGLSSVLATELAARVGPLERIETDLLFSAGDELGPDSLEFLLGAADRSYLLFDDGALRIARPLTEPTTVRFPTPFGERTTYLFPFSDVVSYPRTLGVRSAEARLAIEPAWLGTLARGIARLGLGPLLRRPGSASLRHRLTAGLGRRYADRAGWCVVVHARGARGEASATSSGRCEADAVAASTAELAAQLHERAIARPGVWMPEEVLSPAPFLEAMAAQGVTVAFSAPVPGERRPETRGGAMTRIRVLAIAALVFATALFGSPARADEPRAPVTSESP